MNFSVVPRLRALAAASRQPSLNDLALDPRVPVSSTDVSVCIALPERARPPGAPRGGGRPLMPSQKHPGANRLSNWNVRREGERRETTESDRRRTGRTAKARAVRKKSIAHKFHAQECPCIRRRRRLFCDCFVIYWGVFLWYSRFRFKITKQSYDCFVIVS